MKKLGRFLFSLLVVIFIFTGGYFGIIKSLDIYKKSSKPFVKKKIAVKPYNIKDNKVLNDSLPNDIDEFTFFDTLVDPSMSKFIGLNEKLAHTQEKNNKTSHFDSKSMGRSIVPPSKTQERSDILVSGFVLQIGSFKIFERANSLKNNMRDKGYPTFVVAVRLPVKDETWYRVFIGSFVDKEIADKVKIKVKKVESLDSVVKWHEIQNN